MVPTRLFRARLAVVLGLIQLMRPAKASGFAELPQLTIPISRSVALLRLLAAALLFVTATALHVWPRSWWAARVLAAPSSQVAIITSWQDAKYGTLANGILLVGVLLAGRFVVEVAAVILGLFIWEKWLKPRAEASGSGAPILSPVPAAC